MKNIIKKLAIKKHALIIMYAVTILLYILLSFGNFIYDKITMPSAQELTLQDFELYNLEITGENTLTATGSDPQMILHNTNGNIRSVYYELETNAKGIACAYYTYNVEQDFSNRQRLLPEFGQTKTALYTFPHSGVAKIRLDIGSIAGDVYTFKQLTLNESIPFLNYFKLTNTQVICLLIMPVLIYSVIMYVVNCLYSLKIIKCGNANFSNKVSDEK